ncbi:MAG: tRNA-dihydrouridine synthase [Sulfurospirillaceae bacterium]|jgi:tRNA-dihydrouridine synthase B|nr:tRNA-dihydrouridine synthase [Sulfurospirillaceae bacterium]
MNIIDFNSFPLALAPLAGYTDLPFRQVAKKFGADLTISEMISANALVFKSEKTFKMLEKSPLEEPYIVQLLGSNEDILKDAVEILNKKEGIDGIDLNCGCPVPKVMSQQAGSFLLKDLPKLRRLLETIKLNSKKRYTSAKIRIGFSEKNPKEIAKALADSGIDFLSIHGRTKSGGYHSSVDYEAIKEIKSYLNIPVFANGDIKDVKKAYEVKEFTGCEGVMIGRGAVGAPWIFHQIKKNEDKPTKEIVKEVILEHFDAMIKFHSQMGVVLFRKHLHTYSKNYPNSSEFRANINKIEEIDEARGMIEVFFSSIPKE